MRLVGFIFWVGLFVAGLFMFVDSPVEAGRRLAKLPPVEDSETRQPIAALAVAIDFSGRREGRRVAVLVEDWLYCYPETGDVFLVPRGYETDFASIPGAVRWAVNPFGNHAEAAVIHDWLYAAGHRDNRKDVERKRADQIFRYAMKEQGVNIVRRNVMYRAVRRGGDEAFGRDAEWNFKDPRAFTKAPEPFPKPPNAAVDNIDCADLFNKENDILQKHGSEAFLSE